MRRRVQIGRDVLILTELDDGVEMEGAVRLRPGDQMEVVWPGTGDQAPVVRSAFLWTWAVTRLGSGRPIYTGFCEWNAPSGAGSTPSATGIRLKVAESDEESGISVGSR